MEENPSYIGRISDSMFIIMNNSLFSETGQNIRELFET